MFVDCGVCSDVSRVSSEYVKRKKGDVPDAPESRVSPPRSPRDADGESAR